MKLIYVLADRKLDEFQCHQWMFIFDSWESQIEGKPQGLVDRITDSKTIDTMGVSFMSLKAITKVDELLPGIVYLKHSITQHANPVSEFEKFLIVLFLE
jgi:hypothetical protein